MVDRILPSIMAKDQKELNIDLKKLKGVVKEIHLDVVDGKFAANEAMNFDFKLSSKFRYNVHLMVKDQKKWVERCLKKRNIKTIILHPELFKRKQSLLGLINKIKLNGKKVGLALKPETKVDLIKEYLREIDYILILTVHPGFYGAKFLKSPLKKIGAIKKKKNKIKLIVDGGMSPETIGLAKEADYFVSGSYTTKAKNPKNSIKNLMNKLN